MFRPKINVERQQIFCKVSLSGGCSIIKGVATYLGSVWNLEALLCRVEDGLDLLEAFLFFGADVLAFWILFLARDGELLCEDREAFLNEDLNVAQFGKVEVALFFQRVDRDFHFVHLGGESLDGLVGYCHCR